MFSVILIVWCDGLISTAVHLGFANHSVGLENCGDLPLRSQQTLPIINLGEGHSKSQHDFGFRVWI